MKATVVFFVGISVGVFSNYLVAGQTAYAHGFSCERAKTNRTQLDELVPALMELNQIQDQQIAFIKKKLHRH